MDLKLFLDNNNTGFDIGLDGHDLATDSGFTTAVMVSLYTDRRASNDDVIPDGSDDRRGCWMGMFDDHIKGSRLWLLSREKELPKVLTRAREYAEEALQWLVEKSVATAVTVTAEWVARGVLALRVVITLADQSEFDDVFNYSLEAA